MAGIILRLGVEAGSELNATVVLKLRWDLNSASGLARVVTDDQGVR